MNINAGVVTCRVGKHSVFHFWPFLVFFVFWRPWRHPEREREKKRENKNSAAAEHADTEMKT